MPYRYTGRRIIKNDSDTYEELASSRDLPYINHYKTPRLRHATSSERLNLTRVRHVWKLGDRYWKLSTERSEIGNIRNLFECSDFTLYFYYNFNDSGIVEGIRLYKIASPVSLLVLIFLTALCRKLATYSGQY